MLHIYCGDGKGKSSAAFGAAIRAAGNDMSVLIVQFLKSGSSGEINVLKNIPGITVRTGETPPKFIWNMNEAEKEEAKKQYQKLAFESMKEAEAYQVLIFDEVIAAFKNEMIDQTVLIEFLKEQKEKREIILTGRDPAEELILLADYITEMKKIRHPYDHGIQARKGVEY